eukprot:scaffold1019_cov338-Pavlova_lutheri.AAC.5
MEDGWDAHVGVEDDVDGEKVAEATDGDIQKEEEREGAEGEADVEEDDEFGEFGEAEEMEAEVPEMSHSNGSRSGEVGKGFEDLVRMTRQERSEFLQGYFRAALGMEDFAMEKANVGTTPKTTCVAEFIDEEWREKLANPRSFLQNAHFKWEGSSLQKKLAKLSTDRDGKAEVTVHYEVEIETPAAQYMRKDPRSTVDKGCTNLVRNIFPDESTSEPVHTHAETQAVEAAKATVSDHEEDEEDDDFGPWSDAGTSAGVAHINGDRGGAGETSLLDVDLAYLETLGIGEDPSVRTSRLQKQQRTSGKNVFNELKSVHARKGKGWFGSNIEEAPAEDPFAASDLVPLEIISRKKEKDQSADT